MNFRSQTSTEYLIITAVVIVIALLVVSLLSDIPNIAGDIKADDVVLATQVIGISEYVITDGGMQLTIRNNDVSSKTIVQLSVGDIICSSSDIPITLQVGVKKTITCSNIRDSVVSSSFTEPVVAVYKDLQTDSIFIQKGNNVAVSGRTAKFSVENYIPSIDKSQSTLYQTGSWTNISDEPRKFVFESYDDAIFLCKYGHKSNINSKTFSECDGGDGSQPFVHIKMDNDTTHRPEITAHAKGTYVLEVKVQKSGVESKILRHEFYMFPIRMEALCVNQFDKTNAEYFTIAKQFLRPEGVFPATTQLEAPFLKIDFSDGTIAIPMTFGKELKFNPERNLILMKRVYAKGGASIASDENCRLYVPSAVCRDLFEYGDELCKADGEDEFNGDFRCAGSCPRDESGSFYYYLHSPTYWKQDSNSCDALVFNRDGKGVCIQGEEVLREVYNVKDIFYKNYIFTDKIKESFIDINTDCSGEIFVDNWGYEYCQAIGNTVANSIEETYGLNIMNPLQLPE